MSAYQATVSSSKHNDHQMMTVIIPSVVVVCDSIVVGGSVVVGVSGVVGSVVRVGVVVSETVKFDAMSEQSNILYRYITRFLNFVFNINTSCLLGTFWGRLLYKQGILTG